MVSSLVDGQSQQRNNASPITPRRLEAKVLDRWNSGNSGGSKSEKSSTYKTKRLSPFWNCSYYSSSFIISDPTKSLVNSSSIKKQNKKSIRDYKEKNAKERRVPKRVPSRGMSIRSKPPTLQEVVAVDNKEEKNSELLRPVPSIKSCPTNASEKKMIRRAIKKNLIFDKMSSDERSEFLDAFEHIEVEKGTKIVTQGDKGDFFYIVGMDSIVTFELDGVKILEAEDGGTFGELALIYSSPRAATVIAMSSPTDLFRVDRKTFKSLLMDQIKTKEAQKNRLLEGVDFLKEMTELDRKTLGRAMTPNFFERDDVLVKKGDEGNAFYIVSEGQLRITDISVGGTKFDDVVVKSGDYFGERALALNEPRVANVIAATKGCAFRIDRQTFSKVLGEFSRVIMKAQDRKIVEGIEIFESSQLTKQQFEELANLVVDTKFKRNEKIFSKGQSITAALYLVREGSVNLTGVRSGLIKPGAYFGEDLLLLDMGRDEEAVKGSPTTTIARYTAIAKEDCMCGILPLSECRTIFDTSKMSDDASNMIDANYTDSLEISEELQTEDEEIQTEFSMRSRDALEESSEESSSEEQGTQRKHSAKHEDDLKVVSSEELSTEKQETERGSSLKYRDGLEASSKKIPIDEGLERKSYMKVRNGLEVLSEEISTEEQETERRSSEKNRDDFETLSEEKEVSCSDPVCKSTSQWLTKLSKNGLRRDVQNNLKLEDLKKHEMLGHGQFGEVFLVSAYISPEYGKQLFALKTQKKKDSLRGDSLAVIKREIELLASMDHPYIVNLVHYYENPNEMHILMGAVYGGELFEVIHTENSDGTWSSGLPECDAKFYAMVIADTLDYVHRKQFVYRDLKPENVLIDEDGYPIICDFGFAKFVADKTYTLCGTPNYLSPEIIMNSGHNASTDHWALGILVYEMVAGENPFYYDGISQMDLLRCICQEDFYPLPKSASDEVSSLVEGLLEKDPTLRLGSLVNRGKDIITKEWFQGLNLDDLRQKKHKAPYIPDNKTMDRLKKEALCRSGSELSFVSNADIKHRNGRRESGYVSSMISKIPF